MKMLILLLPNLFEIINQASIDKTRRKWEKNLRKEGKEITSDAEEDDDEEGYSDWGTMTATGVVTKTYEE